jgi:hypothetical protein
VRHLVQACQRADLTCVSGQVQANIHRPNAGIRQYGKITHWSAVMPAKQVPHPKQPGRTPSKPARFNRIWVFIGLLLFCISILSGCRTAGSPFQTAVPTEQLPTVIALTIQAGQALTPRAPVTPTDVPTLIAPTTNASPTRSPIPSQTSTGLPTLTKTPKSTATPTRSPTPSITPTATDTPRPVIPPSAIQILRPAPLSKITSPLQVRVILAPGYGGIYKIELLGEDGRLLARQVLRYPGERVNNSINLDFEIPGVAETGRLQVLTEDQYGRTIALSSTDIILMSVGSDEYNPPGDLRERIFIQKPDSEDLILGGSLTVFGKAYPGQDEPLLVELISESGAVVGQRLVAVQAEEGEDYGIFTAEIPYKVSEATPVRLTIFEDIDRIPGYTHISTLEITINP